MSEQPVPEQAPLRTYDVAEMARICKFHPRNIYGKVSNGEIPERLVARVGKRVLFLADEVDAWLRSGGTKLPAS